MNYPQTQAYPTEQANLRGDMPSGFQRGQLLKEREAGSLEILQKELSELYGDLTSSAGRLYAANDRLMGAQPSGSGQTNGAPVPALGVLQQIAAIMSDLRGVAGTLREQVSRTERL